MKYLGVALLVISVQSTVAKQNWPTDGESCVLNHIHDWTDIFQSSHGVHYARRPASNTDNKIQTIRNQNVVNLDELLSGCGPYEIDIRELTISQIQKHFRLDTLTSVDLTQCYLNRISEIDVYLRSVIEVNPEAIALAERADTKRFAGLNANPLHGIPILIKDNIGTLDLMQTTAGAIALENLKPLRDAEIVTKLRKAGAIILGKASLSEWANFRGGIPSGWNGRRGQTVSAYVASENPSGSSSGSAVSISVNLASNSLGSETDGSIISPSTRNTIVKLKPIVGAVSTRGVIPLAFSNDVVGPMVRSVQDASILMGVISDIDLQGCDSNIFTCLPDRDFRIGVLRDPFWNPFDSSIAAIIPDLERCLYTLSENGLAEVIDPVRVPFTYRIDREEGNNCWQSNNSCWIFRISPSGPSVNQYLLNEVEHLEHRLNRTIYSLADVIKFNELNPPAEGYNQNLLIQSEATNGLRNKTYVALLHEYRRDSVRYLNSIFDENVVATPCYSASTQLLYSYGTAAGYPTITVPVATYSTGFCTGLPFGLCLLGRPFSEPLLLKLGFFIEQSRPAERPVPQIVETLWSYE